jgi:hypothetical protein
MVSQRSMQRTFAFGSWLIGLATILWLVPGCGQNEGGRCQVDSDCASGLFCRDGNTGNGVCEARGTTGAADAAPGPDAAPDAAPDLSSIDAPEADTPSASDDSGAEALSLIDAPTVEVSPVDVAPERTDAAPPAVEVGPVPLDAGATDANPDVSPADAGAPVVDTRPAIDGAPVVDAEAIDALDPNAQLG